jgi:hypothetical protein
MAVASIFHKSRWANGGRRHLAQGLDSERIEPFVDIAALFAAEWHQ